MSGSVARASHLTRRFFTSLSSAPPSAADDAWVRELLSPGAYELWSELPNHDRRHSIGVARRVDAALTGTPHAGDARWLACALLHDVGKVDADLGVTGRVGATVVAATVGRDRAGTWADGDGWTRRVGRYVRHPELGAALIRDAGGPDEAARWAAAHHDRAAWSATGIPDVVIVALHEADDD